MAVNFPGEHPGSARLKSTSECVCGCIECVCVTRCAESIIENKVDDLRSDSAGKACAKLSEHDERESKECKNSEESVFVAENVKMSEREKGSVSTRERVVLVEKEGCATVVMYPERHAAHVFLADGTVITGDDQGAYQVGGSVGVVDTFLFNRSISFISVKRNKLVVVFKVSFYCYKYTKQLFNSQFSTDASI